MKQSETAGAYKPQPRCIAVFVRRIGGQPVVVGVTPSIQMAYRGDEVIWDIICDEDGIEVQIGGFTPKAALAAKQPWKKTDADRKTKTKQDGSASIGDEVTDDADPGDFEYSITLNGSLALDPEVRIRETP